MFLVDVGTLPTTIHLKLVIAREEGRAVDSSPHSSTLHSWIQSALHASETPSAPLCVPISSSPALDGLPLCCQVRSTLPVPNPPTPPFCFSHRLHVCKTQTTGDWPSLGHMPFLTTHSIGEKGGILIGQARVEVRWAGPREGLPEGLGKVR